MIIPAQVPQTMTKEIQIDKHKKMYCQYSPDVNKTTKGANKSSLHNKCTEFTAHPLHPFNKLAILRCVFRRC